MQNEILWNDRELARIWRPRTNLQYAALTSNVTLTLLGGTAGSYKALALDTPIPTPAGWTTMGAIQVGDQVFDDAGQPCTVIGTSPIFHDKNIYEVEFDDSSVLKACEDHQWLTMTAKEREKAVHQTDWWRAKRREKRPLRGTGASPWTSKRNSDNRKVGDSVIIGHVRTTKEIADTLVYRQKHRNHSVALPQPLVLPEQVLPVAPYTLGAWLGDGSSLSGGITVAEDTEILDWIRRDGYEIKKWKAKYAWAIGGILGSLKRMGISPNKRIPCQYLRASFNQRLELLKGLMDTDGCAQGQCVFISTKYDLACDVQELIFSLGMRCGWSTHPAYVVLPDGGRIDCGIAYALRFTPHFPVFKVTRKINRQSIATRGTNFRRYIVAVHSIPTEPVRCITVSSPSHLYLAGRSFIPTHNTVTEIVAAIRFRKRAMARSILFRNTCPELEQMIEEARRLYVRLGAKYNGQERTFHFPSGATVKFDFLDREDHETRQFSTQYDFIAFDESTRNKRGIKRVRFMFSRLRSPDQFLQLYCRMMLGTNPGGPGNNDHKHIFIGPKCCHCALHRTRKPVPGTRLPGKIYYDATWPGGDPITVDPRFPVSTVFIPGRLDEANILGAAYGGRLKTLPGFLQKALLSGCWDITEGQYFDIWDEQTMVVKRQMINDQWWWPHWVSLDYGFSGSTASAHLHCKSPAFEIKVENGQVKKYPRGRIYTIGEIQKEHMLAADFAKLCKQTWDVRNRKIVAWYASPDLWNETGDGHQRSDQMMQAAGINLEQASNDRAGGAMLMYQLLRDLEWQIADSCPQAIAAIPWATHNNEEGGDPDDVLKVVGDPLDDVYDSCICPEVMVCTMRGDIPIAQVTEADYVRTRKGWRKVLKAWRTREAAEILRIRLSNGQVLSGTGEHPVWVIGRGFIRLDALRYGDNLLGCEPFQNLRPSFTTESSFADTPIANTSISGTTSGQGWPTEDEALTACTDRCGKMPTDLSLQRCTFITKTGIRFTTNLAILNCSRQSNISVSTFMKNHVLGKPGSTWTRSDLLLPRGTDQKKGNVGIRQMQKGGSHQGRGYIAGYVVPSFLARRVAQHSALMPVSRNGAGRQGSMISSDSASSAENYSRAADTTNCGSVPVRVLSCTSGGRSPVYNLMVEEEPEFFAAGILVHNCRYGMYSYIGKPDKPREVAIAEAVTSSDPTGAMMQYQMADQKYKDQNAPVFLRRRFRRGGPQD